MVPTKPSVNPSRWSQRLLICLFAGIAASIAFYLGLYEWKAIRTVWDPVFGSGTANVLDSEVSQDITRWIHIPDAVLGSLSYLVDIVFALIGSDQRWKERPWIVMLFGVSVIPVGIVSVTLVILQGTVVGSWCFLCLITAAISLILIFLAYGEVKASILYLLKKR